MPKTSLENCSRIEEISGGFGDVACKMLGDENCITLFGDIDFDNTEVVVAFILHAGIVKKPMVTLVITSPGGEEDPARGLIGAIEFAKSQGVIIRTFGAGIVASAAFDVFIAGSKGYRYIHEVALLMTHSSSADLRNKKEIFLQEQLDELTLTKFTKIDKRTRQKFLETGDWYISPEEAVEYGAADAVIKIGKPWPIGPVSPNPIKPPTEGLEGLSNVD